MVYQEYFSIRNNRFVNNRAGFAGAVIRLNGIAQEDLINKGTQNCGEIKSQFS